ncbi:Flap endonuclease 1 [uncultured archaeon]|nr:Flap endonuclease 1 [uncultured archaeon]
MGVNLGDLAESRTLQWSEMAGKVLAVDAYNTLYQFLSSIRGADGSLLTDTKGRVTSHLTGLFYRSVKWLEAGVKPVFVFDGKPPDLKRKTLDERRERKAEAEKARALALDSGDLESARMYSQATSKLTPEMAAQAKELLAALGIPSLQAPSEGEAQAAELVRQGLAWASASQDYDSLLFGCPRLVRNLSTSGRRKLPRRNDYVNVEPELFELESILSHASLTREQLVWMGMLVGTDFNGGVMGIGPKKAHKLVAGAKSFKEVIARMDAGSKKPTSASPKENPDEENLDRQTMAALSASPASSSAPAGLENWEEIEQFFLHPPLAQTPQITFGKPDKRAVEALLCGQFDFSAERVGRTLDALVEQQKERGAQKTLGEW